MFFLFSNKNKARYGVVLDIGSGSVLVSIVESNPTLPYPEIIWSKYEYAPLRQITNLDESRKRLINALVNAFLALDSEGRKVLLDKNKKAKIAEIQVTISAPWSFTLTKTISYKNDKNSFFLTNDLVEELLAIARQKVEEDLAESEGVDDLGLNIVSRVVSGTLANGYSVKYINKQKIDIVKLIELNSVFDKKIDKKLEEVTDQIFQEIEIKKFSFMTAFYYTILDLYPEIEDFCLVDVTDEATEIGVVRNSILSYSTHMPFGLVSLAREVSEILGITINEAREFFDSSNSKNYLEKYSEAKKKDVESVIIEYQKRLEKLFRRTGDELSVPKVFFLNGDSFKVDFFKQCILTVMEKDSQNDYVVNETADDLLKKYYKDEKWNNLGKEKNNMAILVSAQFFHTKNFNRAFEQL